MNEPKPIPLAAAAQRFVLYDIETNKYVSGALRRTTGDAAADMASAVVSWTALATSALLLPREAAHDARAMVINAPEERGGRPDQFVRLLPESAVRSEAEQVTIYNKNVLGWYQSHQLNGTEMRVTWTKTPASAVFIQKDVATFILNNGYQPTSSIQTRQQLDEIVKNFVPQETQPTPPIILERKQYTIVEADGARAVAAEDLAATVTQKLNEGWQLAGGLSVVWHSVDLYTYYQTMVRSIRLEHVPASLSSEVVLDSAREVDEATQTTQAPRE